MPRVLHTVVATLVAATAIATGCNDGTDFGSLALGGEGKADGGNVGLATSGNTTCTDPAAPAIEKLDPNTLPACTPACGGARCVPADKVPEVSRASFAACGGGYCIPEALIKTGGAKPPSCKSLNNAEGVCLSVCVPQVGEHADALPQVGCASDERCAPCIDPNTNQPTGACAIGTQTKVCENAPGNDVDAPPGSPGAPKCPHEGPPVLDPATLPACGNAGSGAHCLAASLVTPADMKARLTACANGGYCVPDKLIATGGRFVPKTCTSTGGAEGRCQSRVLPEVAAQSNLPVADCDSSERCVPCFNPLDGKATGACSTSCDPGPQKPAVVFSDCCSAQGKCVPSSSVPNDLRKNLQADSCGASELCAPTENIEPGYTPPGCSGWSFLLGDYSGVCLSNCLDFGANGFAMVQGSCDGAHTCVPCTDQNGQPSGAPGCN